MSRKAKFGTVVESCSKKIAASSVWASADTLDGRGGDSASLCGGISPSNTYNTTQGRIDGDLRKFFHFLFISHATTNLKAAKNGRKKTGNRFLISCFGVLPVMGGGYSVLGRLFIKAKLEQGSDKPSFYAVLCVLVDMPVFKGGKPDLLSVMP